MFTISIKKIERERERPRV